MRIIDLLRMSLGSLFKRKFRTILTILGVVIGTISVVVTIGLGIGMEETMIKQVEQYGSLTLIEVSVDIYGNSSIDDNNQLNDDKIEEFKNLDHVKTVVPVLDISVIAKSGKYEMYANIRGLSDEGFKKMGIKAGEGELPKESSSIELFWGNTVAADWHESKSGKYPYYENGELADVNPMTDSVFLIFNTDDYYMAGSSDENGAPVPSPKKYMATSTGVMPGTVDEWSNNGYYIYMNIDTLKTVLKKEYKNKPIPNQPTMKNGKPFKDIFYSRVYVYADDMSNVADIQKQISDMGYDTFASAEWIDSEMKSMQNTQTMIGGIGIVSLVVAAIGIVNTMMMSIYERTKEIGVMKVIGCSIRNIQTLFLLEAAYIGFIGGVIGVSLSYGVSSVINKTFANDELGLIKASTIPPWLSILAVVFATLIGMLSGLLPSIRAMKLSPLEAMRT